MNIILYTLGFYLLAGILFASYFVAILIYKVDKGVEGAHWTFKVMIFPGCVVFWPVLLKKYLVQKGK